MAAGILKRVTPATERTVSDLASREDRSFVKQLDRIVLAGLRAEGLHDEAEQLQAQLDDPEMVTAPA